MKYAKIEKGVITNIIEWDGVEDYPDSKNLVELKKGFGIGDEVKNGKWKKVERDKEEESEGDDPVEN